MSFPDTTQTRVLFAMLTAACLGTQSLGDTMTWTGAAGDRLWSNPANWDRQPPSNPPAPPRPDDDVVFPPNSGVVYVSSTICVNTLTIENGSFTALRLEPGASGDMVIKANSVYVGTGGSIVVLDTDGTGSVIIKTYLSLTNRGLIQADSPGITKSPSADGGSVTITCGGVLDNDGGTIRAGNGQRGKAGQPSGDGGAITLTGTPVNTGTVTPGSGGPATPGQPAGDNGDLKVTSTGPIVIPGMTPLTGEDVMLHSSGPGGAVIMSNRNVPAIQATGGVYIDTCPTCPIDLTGNPPGPPVILAGTEVCLSGMVLLDPGVMLDMIALPEAYESATPCAPFCLDDFTFADGFESYSNDPGIHGQGGWKGWDNDPTFDAFVSEAQHSDGFQSLEIAGTADLVHEVCSRHSTSSSLGMAVSAWQYIPSGFSSNGGNQFAGTYFIVMNTYADGGPHDPPHWSVQMQFDSNDGMMKVFHGQQLDRISIPYETDRWVKIEAIIDLENDWTDIYYDDELIAEYSWTGGVLGDGGGALDVAAIDLYANGSSSVYYDDLRIETLWPSPLEDDAPAAGAAPTGVSPTGP